MGNQLNQYHQDPSILCLFIKLKSEPFKVLVVSCYPVKTLGIAKVEKSVFVGQKYVYLETYHPPSFNLETSQSLTQPQQVDSSKKGVRKKTKSKRGKDVEDEPVAAGRWLPVEEELLATCYVAVSEDNNVERSQKHETFWYRVLNEFNSKNFQKRTKDMLTRKWHTLNANCQKFNAAYKRAKRLEKSGENDVDVMKRGQIDLTGDVPGATQEDLFGHDARPRPAGKPWPAKKTKSDATASTCESSASTQFVELMEQELRLKRKAAERDFEAQAEKDRTLMRLEELRFLATSTKDLDDDPYWIKTQKRLIKNKMSNDLGDEDDEDEGFYENKEVSGVIWGYDKKSGVGVGVDVMLMWL
nr:hypothetical protein [Tanacetum cinerariifolium]